jgi:hypothetical protein
VLVQAQTPWEHAGTNEGNRATGRIEALPARRGLPVHRVRHVHVLNVDRMARFVDDSEAQRPPLAVRMAVRVRQEIGAVERVVVHIRETSFVSGLPMCRVPMSNWAALMIRAITPVAAPIIQRRSLRSGGSSVGVRFDEARRFGRRRRWMRGGSHGQQPERLRRERQQRDPERNWIGLLGAVAFRVPA